MLSIDYDEDDYLSAAQDMAEVIRAGDWGDLKEPNLRPAHPPLSKPAFDLARTGFPPARKIPDRSDMALPATTLPQPHLNVVRNSAALGFSAVIREPLLAWWKRRNPFPQAS